MSNEPIRDEDGFIVNNSIDVIDGRSGDSGREYVGLKQRLTTAFSAVDLFCPDPGAGFRDLKAKGINVVTAKQKSDLLEHIVSRTYFPPAPIAEGVGWFSLGFAYPSGQIFTPLSVSIPIAYATTPVCVRAQGSLEEWQDQVALYVEGQHLPIFCLMLAFAAVLLSLTGIQGNYLVMLSGQPRKGKTTCIELMASVCGPALDGAPRYYLKFNNTLNRLEEWLAAYNNLPFIIDELSSYGTKNSRVSDFRTFIHHLAGVDERGRMGDELRSPRQSRTITVMTSNDTAAELLSHESPDAAAGAQDRLIELPVPTGDEGAFNGLQPDQQAAQAFAEELQIRIGRYHGTAMPAFLERIVAHQAQQDGNLIEGIERRMRQFRELPEVASLGPISSRVMGIVSLAYTAGLLAQHHDVLPVELDCRAAAVHCLRLHLGLRAESDPLQQLLGWIGANEVHDLRGAMHPLSDMAVRKRGAFINECNGVLQLCIAPKLFRRSFPKPRSVLRTLQQLDILKTENEGDRKRPDTKTPVLADGGHTRMYVFVIPDFGEWLEQHGFAPPKDRKAARSR